MTNSLYKELKALADNKVLRANTDTQRGLTCFKYRNLSSDWNNPLIRLARGIVLTTDGIVVNQPYEKFFNYKELEGRDQFTPTTQNLSAWQNSPIAAITEKIDGSLVTISYHQPFGLVVSTSGSVASDSPLVKLITDFVISSGLAQRLKQHPRWTIICEYYDLDHMLVYDYGKQPRLWLHAARTNYTGQLGNDPLVNDQTLRQIGKELHLEVVKSYHFDNVDEIQHFLHDLHDSEGVVVTFKNGIKLKLKSDQYLHLHQITELWFNQLTKQQLHTFIQQFHDGTIDDAIAMLNNNTNLNNKRALSEINMVGELYQHLITQFQQALPTAQRMKHDVEYRKNMFSTHQITIYQQLMLNNLDYNGNLTENTYSDAMHKFININYKTIIDKIKNAR